MNKQKRKYSQAMAFVVLFGIVSLFSDMTHEGASSIRGAYLTLLVRFGRDDRLHLRPRRARGLLDALCVRQAHGQDQALLDDDDRRLRARCAGRAGACARRRARLDLGVRAARHPAHGQGRQKAREGHHPVLCRLAGGRRQELRHSGGARPDRCVPRPGAAVSGDALQNGRHNVSGLFHVLCGAGYPGRDHACAAARDEAEIPESRALWSPSRRNMCRSS